MVIYMVKARANLKTHEAAIDWMIGGSKLDPVRPLSESLNSLDSISECHCTVHVQ